MDQSFECDKEQKNASSIHNGQDYDLSLPNNVKDRFVQILKTLNPVGNPTSVNSKAAATASLFINRHYDYRRELIQHLLDELQHENVPDLNIPFVILIIYSGQCSGNHASFRPSLLWRKASK